MNDKPYSEACAENAAPIFAVLERVLADARSVLEIGSGTGQHAVYFAPRLPHLIWQTGDVPGYHYAIQRWLDDEKPANARPPIDTDMASAGWQTGRYDAVFSANTLHIMDWPAVEAFFAGVARVLGPGGLLIVYGPFHYHGVATSESNARFDAMLRARGQGSGVRDFVDVNARAEAQGFVLREDIAMPVNNRTLIWQKSV